MSIYIVVAEDFVKARDEVVEVVSHSQVFGDILNDSASKLHALIFLRLESVFDVSSNFLEFYFVTATHDHSVESNETIVGNFFSLLEEVNDHLDHIVSEGFFNFVTDFDKNGLQKVAK